MTINELGRLLFEATKAGNGDQPIRVITAEAFREDIAAMEWCARCQAYELTTEDTH